MAGILVVDWDVGPAFSGIVEGVVVHPHWTFVDGGIPQNVRVGGKTAHNRRVLRFAGRDCSYLHRMVPDSPVPPPVAAAACCFGIKGKEPALGSVHEGTQLLNQVNVEVDMLNSTAKLRSNHHHNVPSLDSLPMHTNVFLAVYPSF